MIFILLFFRFALYTLLNEKENYNRINRFGCYGFWNIQVYL